MNDNEILNNCLSDFGTFYITVSGILLSIFTLIYSFIKNKKNELKIISERIKLGDNDPINKQRHKFATEYFLSLVRLNKKCIYLLSSTTFFTIFSYIGKYFQDKMILEMLFLIISIFTIFFIIIGIRFAIKIIKLYKNDINI